MNDIHSTCLNKHNIRNSFNKACDSYDLAATLQRKVADNLINKLMSISFNPMTIVDLGAGTGYCTLQILKYFKPKQLIAFDLAENMLIKIKQEHPYLECVNYVCADAEELPVS